MRWQRLFVTGFVLLLVLFISGCGSVSTSSGSPPTQTNKTLLITRTTVPALQIEADIPLMEVNQQVFIAVSIYPTGATESIGNVRKVENATPVVTNATPVGTPGNTLINAFGPNQSVVATATLETSPTIFSVTPNGPQPKPLDQYSVEWDWFVTPLVAGKQLIGVDIETQWTSTLTRKQGSSYTLGYPKFPVSIQALPVVPTPTPTAQTTDNSGANATIWAAIISTLGVIIAALLAIPSFRRWVGNLLFGKARHPQ